jgi:hypothetical protein
VASLKPGRRLSCVGCSYLKRIESSFQPTGTRQCKASLCVILWEWRMVLTQQLALSGTGRDDCDIQPRKHWTRPTITEMLFRDDEIWNHHDLSNIPTRQYTKMWNYLSLCRIAGLASTECIALSNGLSTWLDTIIYHS